MNSNIINDAKQKIFEHYDYISKIVGIKASQYDLDFDECLNFVLDEIKKENYKKIIAFRGKSKFTTFITVVINRLIISFARKNKRITNLPPITTETPLDILLNQQYAEKKEILLKHLPGLLQELDFKEKLVVKMKYFKGLNISRISKNLNMTRYEIDKILASSLEFLRNRIKELCNH